MSNEDRIATILVLIGAASVPIWIGIALGLVAR